MAQDPPRIQVVPVDANGGVANGSAGPSSPHPAGWTGDVVSAVPGSWVAHILLFTRTTTRPKNLVQPSQEPTPVMTSSSPDTPCATTREVPQQVLGGVALG